MKKLPHETLKRTFLVREDELTEKDGLKGLEIGGVFAPVREFRKTFNRKDLRGPGPSWRVAPKKFEEYMLSELPPNGYLGKVLDLQAKDSPDRTSVEFRYDVTIHGVEAKERYEKSKIRSTKVLAKIQKEQRAKNDKRNPIHKEVLDYNFTNAFLRDFDDFERKVEGGIDGIIEKYGYPYRIAMPTYMHKGLKKAKKHPMDEFSTFMGFLDIVHCDKKYPKLEVWGDDGLPPESDNVETTNQEEQKNG